MASSKRKCEMAIPAPLVERMEAEPEGIGKILKGVEKQFGITTSSSYMGKKNYVIIGPNPDILELALETLRKRYFDQRSQGTEVSGNPENKRAVWRFHGDYAVKISHLFETEIRRLMAVKSVKVSSTPLKLEVTCGYEDLGEVKPMMEALQTEIDSLYEEELLIDSSHTEMMRLHKFLKSKERYDRNVVFIWHEKSRRLSIYGKTEISVKKAISDWKMDTADLSPRQMTASPTLSNATSLTRNELRIPGGVVSKLETQKCGIDCVIANIEKEFGLKVHYVRKKHLIIEGPHLDLLELAAQTLVHRYILKAVPDNGVVGNLQGKNAVWRFLGNYARKVFHLFQPELKKLQRVRTVTVKATPSKANPSNLEILCSFKKVSIVKFHVEKIVGLVHNLIEKEVKVPKSVKDLRRLKEYLNQKNEMDKSVLCIFDEKARLVTVYGRHEGSVWQAWGEIDSMAQRQKQHVDIPEEYWHMHRKLFQTKIPGDVVRKLEKCPKGIIPLVQRIEKEYGVKIIYHRNKQLILISPTPEVLELAHETLESRYVEEALSHSDSEEEDASKEGKDGESVVKRKRRPKRVAKLVKFTDNFLPHCS